MMKLATALAASALLISTSLRAADPAPAAPAAGNLDFSKFKTADDFWALVEKLQTRNPGPAPTSREDAMAQLSTWFLTERAAADAFVKAFPNDPRRWQAKMLSLRSGRQLRRLGSDAAPLAADQLVLNQIMSDPDAPVTVMGEAAFMNAAEKTALLDPSKPETYIAFQNAAADFLAKFGDHPLAAQMRALQLRALATDPTPEGGDALQALAASKDPKIAGAANEMIAHRLQIADLKKKPVNLKFTAVDGHPVDLANLRGKVVLVDFWASWCGPCMGEMPNVVATYQKLHPKGFEILGISLDQDKAKMEAALQKQGMTWAQYFDGEGWKNKISSAYGVGSIPASWLIDKKGMLRQTDLRGDALGEGVEKLLAE
jgi:thiol-disulfide isomerase/thioredoxin